MEMMFAWLGELFKRLEGKKVYSVDSFPVELCAITREKRCRLWNSPELKGYNASKCRFFLWLQGAYGVTTNKEPVHFFISEGSMHDVTAAYSLLAQLPRTSMAIGDKGYISGTLQRFLEKMGVTLSPIVRKNMHKDPNHGIKRRIRKGVETAFSLITAKFGKVIKATTISDKTQAFSRILQHRLFFEA